MAGREGHDRGKNNGNRPNDFSSLPIFKLKRVVANAFVPSVRSGPTPPGFHSLACLRMSMNATW